MTRPPSPTQTRRQFVRLLTGGAALLLGCPAFGDGRGGASRLTARPTPPSGTLSPGLHSLGLEWARLHGLLYVPSSHDPALATPLVLALHGAGGNAHGPINALSPYAESHGFVLLAVDSQDSTWDAIDGSYGPDVRFIDHALRYVFARCVVDPARLVIRGFSDGASYALGLGLTNGDLFTRIVAHSPGFIPPSDTLRTGTPELFVSHGTLDPVLPIDATSRVLVPSLRSLGYDVTYVEFDGGHTVPPDVALSAATWLTR